MQSSINKSPVRVMDATLSGIVRDGSEIDWSIDVQLGRAMVGDHVVKPRLYIEKAFLDAKSLHALCRRTLVIDRGAAFSGNEILPGRRLCCVYLLEHEFLEDNRISLSRGSSGEMAFSWTAICGSEAFGKVSFDLHGKIEFLGINLGTGSIDESLKKLGFQMQGMAVHTQGESSYLLPQLPFAPSPFDRFFRKWIRN